MRSTNQLDGDPEEAGFSHEAETTTELRRRLADARTQLAELDRSARRLVKERPLTALGVALAVGVLLGRALSRK